MPDITIPQGAEQDIYSLGFDKNLNREIATTNSSVVYDSIKDAISSGQLVANASGGTVGGFSITPSLISVGSGSVTAGLSATKTSADDTVFFAGDSSPSRAPFRVTESGAAYGGFTYKTGQQDGASTVQFNHNLGRKPTFVKIIALDITNGSISYGNWDGTNEQYLYLTAAGSGASSTANIAIAGASTGNSWSWSINTAPPNETQITLTRSQNGVGGGTTKIIWEALV